MSALRRYTGLVGVSSVLLVFSEYVFLNEGVVAPLLSGPPDAAALLHVGEMLLFYLVFGAAFAAVVSAFGAGTLAALLLAGALCGWAIEALLVAVVYEAVPLSYAWPSLGWHMIVDVWVGLSVLPALLAARSAPVALMAAVGAGLVWGAWASWIWVEGLRPTPAGFAGYAAFVVAFLIAAYAVVGWAGAAAFGYGRWERRVIALICLALALVTGLPFLPWLAALAALAGLALAALAFGGRSARGLDRLPLARAPLPPARLGLLAAAAPAAGLGYWWMEAGDRMLDVELVAVPLTFLGIGLFLWALLRMFTRN